MKAYFKGMSIIEGKKLVIPLLSTTGIKLSKTTLKSDITNPEVRYNTLSTLIDRFNPDVIFFHNGPHYRN